MLCVCIGKPHSKPDMLEDILCMYLQSSPIESIMALTARLPQKHTTTVSDNSNIATIINHNSFINYASQSRCLIIHSNMLVIPALDQPLIINLTC